MVDSYPFCVIERPYVLWSGGLVSERERFLTSIDTGFYDRWVHLLVQPPSDGDNDDSEEAERSDHSSLIRLLWHHGIETLLMLVGAFMQAPGAPHAYFTKCKNEDVVELAASLVQEKPLRYVRLKYDHFTILGLLALIHEGAPWAGGEQTLEHFRLALVDMLMDYTMPQSRWEYNGIKHGLRARHGRFLVRVGIEETYGVAPPEESFGTLGYSESSSSFYVPKLISGATKQQSRVNFALDNVAVPWSLDRVLCDLRIVSMLANNVVSALKRINGAPLGTCRFIRIAEQEWWDFYQGARLSGVKSSSFGVEAQTDGDMPAAEDVYRSYESGRWRWPPTQDK